jgi:cell fate (sporulation/competence/biofilm development) regulator YlbF (YheA/YmcA/DUF963 family)
VKKSFLEAFIEELSESSAKEEALEQLQTDLNTTSDPAVVSLMRDQITKLQGETKNCFRVQAGTIKIKADETCVIFFGEQAPLEMILNDLSSDISEKVKQRIINTYNNNPIWMTAEQGEEIEKRAKLYAKQLLLQLTEERTEKLKEKSHHKKEPEVSRKKLEERPEKSESKKAVEEEEITKLENKADIKRRIAASEIEQKTIEEARRKHQKAKKEEELLAQESDEIKREAWKKEDLNREIKKQSYHKKDILR